MILGSELISNQFARPVGVGNPEIGPWSYCYYIPR